MNSCIINNICEIHKMSQEFICYDCNVLACSVCSLKHGRHSYDHIYNIKSKIKDYYNKDDSVAPTDDNEINNSNNNNIIGFKDIENSIQTTFNSLTLKVAEYEQLQQTEQEVSNKFKELHEFLIVEEYRLRKPIIESKQQLEQQIDKQIKIMKSLNIPTTHTLFYFDDQLDSKVNNNDHDHSLLNGTYLNINKTIKINNNDDNQQTKPQQYQLIVNNEQINQIKNQIQSSFKLKSNHSNIQPKHKQSYIFSTDMDNKISIINITNRDNIHFEQGINMEMIYDSQAAFNSTVKVGDFIYIFGGGRNNNKHNKFIKYSINTKAFVVNEMKGVDPCKYLSACYDGQDHIYLFDGNTKTNTDIYRFNINDSTFERYTTIEIKTEYHQLTFLFKDYIYTFTPNICKLFKFDMKSKTMVELPYKIPDNSSRAACTDGNGNIYILSVLGLQRFKVETNEIKLLDNNLSSCCCSNAIRCQISERSLPSSKDLLKAKKDRLCMSLTADASAILLDQSIWLTMMTKRMFNTIHRLRVLHHGLRKGVPIRHIPSIWILVWLQRASARGVTATANTQLF
ncbi:hypothetical protein PPL_07475 [Heterostelium album PN500]|uniref:B box-type domain-containing protein n=1 Tax=Heterostelium pallidum (strain ATCC 26659 / Pp 5 / PN500) TaxID=670386 RepID=D3BG24_HETP5|nr:hypothetical protein PPL_07475 [Heterostelium album PN500]EFA79616.1 hypothetical protein PPL_07475 [Heterostelium album PN500]|eukprot:XP_020431737.1 hypothetical protein PPL_07475 [Heterostelium album PN500]